MNIQRKLQNIVKDFFVKLFKHFLHSICMLVSYFFYFFSLSPRANNLDTNLFYIFFYSYFKK